jgi:hypothetical protein
LGLGVQNAERGGLPVSEPRRVWCCLALMLLASGF